MSGLWRRCTNDMVSLLDSICTPNHQQIHAIGPIVRVRPDALHINDPNFIDKLYSQSPKQRRERYWTVLQNIQAPGSILATKDHDLHRRRRAVLNPYFSQQNVRRLEPVVNQTLANLLHRMNGWASSGAPIHMNVPIRAATNDIIQAYAFGEGKKYLEMEDCRLHPGRPNNTNLWKVMLHSSMS